MVRSQRFCHQMALLLAGDDLLRQHIHIPALTLLPLGICQTAGHTRGLPARLTNSLGSFCMSNSNSGSPSVKIFKLSTPNHQMWRTNSLCQIFHIGNILALQGAALEIGSRLCPSLFSSECASAPGFARSTSVGINDQRNHTFYLAGSEIFGRMKDQRNACRAVKHRHFVPQAPLTQHVAMIGGEDDHCVFGLIVGLCARPPTDRSCHRCSSVRRHAPWRALRMCCSLISNSSLAHISQSR